MTKIDTKKLVLRPVPAGHKIKYIHQYKRHGQDQFPKIYVGTRALLLNETGSVVNHGQSKVHKGDTPIKKLGRAIAHNRCIKEFEKSHA